MVRVQITAQTIAFDNTDNNVRKRGLLISNPGWLPSNA